MPSKTNINNLNIVWQGQSWSVITPSGDVIGRFKEKNDAIRFAEITKDYAKKKPHSSFNEKPKSKFSGFDGELNIEVDDISWADDDVIIEKSKNALYSSSREKIKPWLIILIIVIILVIGFFVARSLVAELAGVTPSVFPASNIFWSPNTVLFLVIASIAVPVVLLILNVLPSVRTLLGYPIGCLGYLGLGLGIIFGIIYFILSIFTNEDDTGRILITFSLWLWISFCMIFLATKMVDDY